jgi:4-amino-4-deoxy-L-arabinose transferase-like glycosyltransferase
MTPKPTTATPDPSSGPPAATGDEAPLHPGLMARAGIFLGVVLLALAYVLPGLIGHDPWTPDEADAFGMIHGLVTSGDPVVSTLAGEPALDHPPGYALAAAGTTVLLRDWLPMHDAARVATGLFLAVTLVFSGLMARRAWGAGFGGAAVLAVIGTLGLIPYGHLLGPDTALAAGIVMGCYGLLRARESAAWGGLWLGTGTGLSFLTQGLAGPGILLLCSLLLLLFSDWRNRHYARALAVALVLAAPWFLVWPAELYLRSPDLLGVWLTQYDPRPFLAALSPVPKAPRVPWLSTLPWATFPLLPLALWTLARRPGLAFRNPGVRVALVVSLCGWAALLYAGTALGLGALPLLAPLAVIAAGGVRDLPGWLVALGYWLSLLVFTALAVALWGLWGYGSVTGQPPQWPLLGRYLPLDFRVDVQTPTDANAVLVALALTLAWLLTVKRLRPARPGALAAWPLGLTLSWGLAMLLHLPWLDAARSDRGVFAEMASRLPAGSGCVATPAGQDEPAEASGWNRIRLPTSERGLLYYFTGVRVVPAATLAEVSCDWVLIEVGEAAAAAGVDLGLGWDQVWQGRRPVGRGDVFLLFGRTQGPAAAVLSGTPAATGPPEAPPAGGLGPEGPTTLEPSGEATPEPEAPPAPEPEQETIPHA